MIITLAGQKGGTGKSTQSLALAFEYCTMGFDVMLVDTDKQRTLMQWHEDRGEERPLPPKLMISGMVGTKLHKDIPKIMENYHHIIIDTPGQADSDIIVRSASIISDVVIIPTLCSAKSLRSTRRTIEVMKEMKIMNPNLKVFLLFNRVENTSMRATVEPMALSMLGDEIKLMKTEISKRVIYDRADFEALAVQEVGHNKEVVDEIRSLIREIEDGKDD